MTRNNLPDGAARWGFQASVRQIFQLASLLTSFSNTGCKLCVLGEVRDRLSHFLPDLEIALVLVRLDHVANSVVHADHTIG
jgi:hypothetical protein